MNKRFSWLRVAVPSLLAAALALGACGPTPEDAASAAPPAETVVYLLRHAEALYPPPEDDPRNPPLNVLGQDRADALARLLSAETLDHLWSTDYHRTQQTAAPLATLKRMEVEAYDPRDLAGFATQLLGMPGRHVVFGHSNTTPEMVAALGGDPGEPIDESIEFDRLYVVSIAGSGQVTTSLLRYGAPTPEDWRESAATRR